VKQNNMRELALERIELWGEKAKWEAELNATKEALKAVDEKLYQAMLDSDSTRCNFGGYNFILAPKARVNVSPENQEKLIAAFREQGFGGIVKESVNAQTLDAQVRRLLEENDGALPEWLESIVTLYTQRGISMRKA